MKNVARSTQYTFREKNVFFDQVTGSYEVHLSNAAGYELPALTEFDPLLRLGHALFPADFLRRPTPYLAAFYDGSHPFNIGEDAYGQMCALMATAFADTAPAEKNEIFKRFFNFLYNRSTAGESITKLALIGGCVVTYLNHLTESNQKALALDFIQSVYPRRNYKLTQKPVGTLDTEEMETDTLYYRQYTYSPQPGWHEESFDYCFKEEGPPPSQHLGTLPRTHLVSDARLDTKDLLLPFLLRIKELGYRALTSFSDLTDPELYSTVALRECEEVKKTAAYVLRLYQNPFQGKTLKGAWHVLEVYTAAVQSASEARVDLREFFQILKKPPASFHSHFWTIHFYMAFTRPNPDDFTRLAAWVASVFNDGASAHWCSAPSLEGAAAATSKEGPTEKTAVPVVTGTSVSSFDKSLGALQRDVSSMATDKAHLQHFLAYYVRHFLPIAASDFQSQLLSALTSAGLNVNELVRFDPARAAEPVVSDHNGGGGGGGGGMGWSENYAALPQTVFQAHRVPEAPLPQSEALSPVIREIQMILREDGVPPEAKKSLLTALLIIEASLPVDQLTLVQLHGIAAITDPIALKSCAKALRDYREAVAESGAALCG